MRGVFALASVILLASACGGASDAQPKSENDEKQSGDAQPKKKSGFGVQQEMGELDEKKTSATFEQVSSQLQKCFTQGVARLPYMSGEVRLVVRIAESGSVKWAYVKESTLGDRETENCMLGALKSASWPKPVGGDGQAEKGLSFDPGGDERPPVAWSPDRLGGALGKAKGELSSCRSSAGAGPMSATLYVGTNGKAQAVGVAGNDEKSEKAVSCVQSALEHTTFPSPGSWPAKVTIPID